MGFRMKNIVIVPHGTLQANLLFDEVVNAFGIEHGLDALISRVDIFQQLFDAVNSKNENIDIDIDGLANLASTSPLNDLPMPTQAQLEANDYAKGVISINGITIHIENPKGSIRKGKTWEREMTAHYGYIDKTMGADGDELDVFVKAGIKRLTDTVYVIKQVDQEGNFDEHKLVLGADSLEEAKQIYLSNYRDGWDGLGSIYAISFSDLKKKLNKVWNEFDSLNNPNFGKKVTQNNIKDILNFLTENSDKLLSNTTTSPNYRWADQGYVAGSKKELAKMLKEARDAGTTVTVNSFDWKMLKDDPRLAEAMLVKKNLIGKVDWLAFKDQGMDSKVAYFIKRIYAQIGQMPLAPLMLESQQNYVNAISNFRQEIEKCKTYEDLKKFIVDLWGVLRTLPPKALAQIYTVDLTEEKKASLIKEIPSYGNYDCRVTAELGEKLYSWLLKSGNYALHEAKTGINVKTKTKSKGENWDWVEKSTATTSKKERTKGFQLEPAHQLERIGGKDIKITSSKELQDLVGLRAVQSGNYVLKDKDSAEYHMTNTAQAMSDMSDVLQIPIKELGLNGNLAIAFGARGKGGALAHYEPAQRVVNITKLKGGGSLGHEVFHAIDNLINDLSTGKVGSAGFMGTNNFSQMQDTELGACFEYLVKAMTVSKGFMQAVPSVKVAQFMQENVNRTNTVINFLDSHVDCTVDAETLIQDMNECISDYLAQYPRRDPKATLTTPYAINQVIEVALTRHFFGISDFYNTETGKVSFPLDIYTKPTQFIQDANSLERGGSNYWSSNHELSARAFTSYLIDKLAENGQKNDYLAYEGRHDAVAFPQGEERKVINKAFDDLFKLIRDKKIFKLASQNTQLLDDLFNNKDQAPLPTKVTKENISNVLAMMYAKMLSRQIQQDNQDTSLFTVDKAETPSEFANRLLLGETEINQDILLQLQAGFSELNTNEKENILNFTYSSLIEADNSQDALNILELSKKQPLDDQLFYLIASQACNAVIIPHTTKRGKLLEGIILTDIAYQTAKEIDKYSFRKDGGFFVRKEHLLSCDDYLLNDDQLLTKQALSYVSDTNDSTFNSSSVRGRTTGSGNSDVGRGENGGMVGQPAQSTNANGGDDRHGGNSLSTTVPTSEPNGSNRTDEPRDGRTEPDIEGSNSDTGATNGGARSPIERERDQHAIADANQTRSELERRLESQQNAPQEVKAWADLEDIETTLPVLLPEQQEDVFKIETRLQSNDSNGILVTNGTGTGKTFTGLGAIKRIVNSGKKNILIVVMNDKILRDFVKSGKALGLEIYPLKDTKENGQGHIVSIATFNNLSANKSLFKREFDAILVDEAHNLMQSAEAKVTGALDALRGLTGHHSGFQKWFLEKHGEKSVYDLPEDKQTDEAKEKWNNLIDSERKKWESRWEKQENLPKVIFLSATPFSYLKCVDWAEGYLFNYIRPEDQYTKKLKAYNTASDREQFFVNNFGFRMRYNKLTTPRSQEFSGANEREFNENLKLTGALTGRQIKLKHDYDRKFILIDSNVGNMLDAGFTFLQVGLGYDEKTGELVSLSNLSNYLIKAFTYTKRRQLLESIKADWLISYVKKNLALNRKVVIFHDYNTGGSIHPFKLSKDDFNELEVENSEEILYEYELFKKKRPDLVNLKVDFDSAINIFKTSFSKPLFFSGRLSKKDRQKNVDLFNTDNSGYDILIVQSDAGSTGISLHDTTGTHQRVSINIGQPIKPAKLRQTEGRIYRVGQASNAIQRYLTTGTDWERSAFVETIAGRAETVDNLSQGRMAKVSIKEALITAYNDADYEEPSENDGIGGKAQDAEAERNLDLSPFQKAIQYYEKKQKVTANRNNREGKDWYATPEPLGLAMVKWSGAHSGDKVLEPSAGDGSIMRFAPDGISLTMVEQSESLATRARMANTEANVIVTDFLKDHGTNNKYHSIVMNPPFGSAGKDAIKHMTKAFDHLYDNGRLVALVPCGTMDNLVVDWLKQELTAHWVARIALPPCTFENAGTSIATQVLIFDKVANGKNVNEDGEPLILEPEKSLNYRDLDDISDLFIKLDIISSDNAIPRRKPRLDESLKKYGLFVDPEKSKYLVSGVGLENNLIKPMVSSFLSKYSPDGILWYYNYSEKLLQKLIDFEQANGISLKLK